MARNFQTLSMRVPLGTTWEENWQLLQSPGGPPVDLTGYEARMMLRESIEDVVPLALFETGEELTISGVTGTIAMRVEASAVSALSPSNERINALYDIELFIPGAPDYVVPLFQGKVTLLPRVTRP